MLRGTLAVPIEFKAARVSGGRLLVSVGRGKLARPAQQRRAGGACVREKRAGKKGKDTYVWSTTTVRVAFLPPRLHIKKAWARVFGRIS